MPLFGQPGLTLDRLMIDAGLMPEMEPEGSGNIRSYAAMRYDRQQAYREQVAREESPVFVYFYDEGNDEYIEFFNFTTTAVLREMAEEMGLELVSLEDGKTPEHMTRAQIDALIRTLFVFVDTEIDEPVDEVLKDVTEVLIELEDGLNPQMFSRNLREGSVWKHDTNTIPRESFQPIIDYAAQNVSRY